MRGYSRIKPREELSITFKSLKCRTGASYEFSSCGCYAERKSSVYGDSSVRNIGLCHLHKRAFWRKFITSQRINDWKLSEVAFQIIYRVLSSYVFSLFSYVPFLMDSKLDKRVNNNRKDETAADRARNGFKNVNVEA